MRFGAARGTPETTPPRSGPRWLGCSWEAGNRRPLEASAIRYAIELIDGAKPLHVENMELKRQIACLMRRGTNQVEEIKKMQRRINQLRQTLIDAGIPIPHRDAPGRDSAEPIAIA